MRSCWFIYPALAVGENGGAQAMPPDNAVMLRMAAWSWVRMNEIWYRVNLGIIFWFLSSTLTLLKTIPIGHSATIVETPREVLIHIAGPLGVRSSRLKVPFTQRTNVKIIRTGRKKASWNVPIFNMNIRRLEIFPKGMHRQQQQQGPVLIFTGVFSKRSKNASSPPNSSIIIRWNLWMTMAKYTAVVKSVIIDASGTHMPIQDVDAITGAAPLIHIIVALLLVEGTFLSR